MLHLRLITPTEQTEDAVRLIKGTVGTTHLCVLSGAARDPVGDVVLCDVAREAADDLLSGLQRLGLDTTGSIAVENVDLSLSERADRAEDEAPGEGADAVLWEHLTEATHEESTLSVTYLSFLTLATMIAACGVVLDNAVLIVGAMAVGPEFGPLAGVSTATVQRRPRLAMRSLIALLVGFAVAMALTVAFSLFMDAVGLFTEEQLKGERPQTGFVYAPDWFSFVVAVLAGAAGTLSLTSAKPTPICAAWGWSGPPGPRWTRCGSCICATCGPCRSRTCPCISARRSCWTRSGCWTRWWRPGAAGSATNSTAPSGRC